MWRDGPGRDGTLSACPSSARATRSGWLDRRARSLDVAHRFWCDGVGLAVLWRRNASVQGGHALLMLGVPGATWHLELVADAGALDTHPPGPEDLLVVYRGEPLAAPQLARLEAAGGRRVAARNPYWDEFGTTVQDPDGFLLVLSHRSWS